MTDYKLQADHFKMLYLKTAQLLNDALDENTLLKERVDNLESEREEMDEFIDRYQERCRNGG